MLVTSPRVKIKVTAMINPMNEFKATDHMIAFGNVIEASLISSAVFCSAQSKVRYNVLGQGNRAEPTHMHRAVISKQAAERRGQTDHGRQASIRPAAIVGESKKDVVRISPRGQDPKGNDDGKEAGHMDDKNDAFDQRQLSGQRRVEEYRKADDGNSQQRPVPGLVFVLFVVQDDQALDDRPDNEGDDGEEDLPPCRTEPSLAQP